MTEILIVGIGDPLRGDDGAGPAVIERLRRRSLPGVRLETHWGEGASLMALWQSHRQVILVDAMASGAPPGTLRWFGPENLPGSGTFPYSTHRFGLAEALQLAAVLGELPEEVRVLGIEGRAFEGGGALSPEVERAVEQACASISEMLPRLACFRAAKINTVPRAAPRNASR